MRLKSLIRKSIPKIPTDSSGQQRRFAESVSENLDTLTGRRGNLIDRAVTFRDLLEVGVLKKSSSLTQVSSGGDQVDVVTDDGDGDASLPTAASNLTATGGFGFIQLNWSLTRYRGHAYVEIFRAQKTGTAIPTLSDAQASGVFDVYYGDTYFYQDTKVNSNETFYYWVRAVNVNGVTGAFSNAANATTAIDYIHVSGLIDDILDDNVNTLGLNTALANASGSGAGTPAVWNSSTTYAKDKLVTYNGRIYRATQGSTNQTPSSSSSYWTDVGAYTLMSDFVTAAQDDAVTTSATLETFQTNQAATNGSVSSDITALENTVNDSTTGVNATATAVSGLSTSVGYNAATGVSSVAQDVTTLSSTVNDSTTGVAVTASAVNGIQGKYSVKIDNNGNVAGFGLISTANTGVPTTGTGSAFIIAADRFAISADYNTSETALANVDKYPFKVFTANTTVNGEVIPAGVYIKDAYIHDAQITDAKIKDATITNAKIVGLEAGKITSGDIQITNSNDIKIYQGKTSYSSTSSGFWLGNLNGSAAFNIGDSTKYFKFDGGSGVFEATGAIIKDATIDTLKIGANAVTVPDGISGNISVTLGTSYTKVGELTVDYDNVNHTPSGVIGIAGVQVSGNTSGSDQTLNVELRRVYTGGGYNGQHVAESVKSDFGHVTTIGAHWTVSQVSTATTFKLELWAKVHTGSRTANRYFISAITSKR